MRIALCASVCVCGLFEKHLKCTSARGQGILRERERGKESEALQLQWGNLVKGNLLMLLPGGTTIESISQIQDTRAKTQTSAILERLTVNKKSRVNNLVAPATLLRT